MSTRPARWVSLPGGVSRGRRHLIRGLQTARLGPKCRGRHHRPPPAPPVLVLADFSKNANGQPRALFLRRPRSE